MNSMARNFKKEAERHFVEAAAKMLDVAWTLNDEDRENPDFVVTEVEHQFGLEVTEIFTGPEGKHGAQAKAEESETMKVVHDLQRKYERQTSCPLSVKFLGNMNIKNLDKAAQWLLACDFPSKPLANREETEIDEANGKLRIYATRAITSMWVCVNHRTGAVDLHPAPRIAERIEEKAANIARYRETCGLQDIRLLIVANCIWNSGKLKLREGENIATLDFERVYFSSYPEEIQVFAKD